MRDKGIEKIKMHFAAFGRAEFEKWLKEGLKGSYLPSNNHDFRPFDPVYPEMVYHNVARDYDSIPDFLGLIYDRFFSDSGKKMFREAIGDLLDSQINKTELTTKACNDLIYLIPTVSAEESLDSLVSFVGEVKSRKVDLYATIAVLRYFKSSEKVYEATERLANSSNFDEGYLFEIIGILVKKRPSDTRDIIRKFEPRVKKLWGSLPDDVTERKAFSEAKSECLRRVSRVADAALYTGTWLTEDYKS